MRILDELGHMLAEGEQCTEHVSKAAFVRRRISYALVRGNARVYNKVAEQMVRQSGRSFTSGGDVPVAECVD